MMLRATPSSEGVVEKNPDAFPGFFGTRGRHSPPKTFFLIFLIARFILSVDFSYCLTIDNN